MLSILSRYTSPVVPKIDRKAICNKVHWLCARSPGATFYNAAEYALDEVIELMAPPAPVSVSQEFICTLTGRAKFLRDQGEIKSPELLERAAAILQGAEPVTTDKVPEGWKLVPIEPNKDMLRAGQSEVGFWLNTVRCYSKMIAAAPVPPAPVVPDEMTNKADTAEAPKSELAQRASKILADATELANRISDQVGNEYQQFASLAGAEKRNIGIKDLVSSEIADFFAGDATKFVDGKLAAEMQKEIMKRIATCFYAE